MALSPRGPQSLKRALLALAVLWTDRGLIAQGEKDGLPVVLVEVSEGLERSGMHQPPLGFVLCRRVDANEVLATAPSPLKACTALEAGEGDSPCLHRGPSAIARGLIEQTQENLLRCVRPLLVTQGTGAEP